MVFWTKKKKEEDIKAVKEAVSGPPPLPPEETKMPTIELEKSPERTRFAPLFIKIDRYNEVLKNIEGLKNVMLNLRDLLLLNQQMEKIRAESQNMLQKNIQEISRLLTELDKEFVRPRGLEEMGTAIKTSMETERIEDYVGELERELQNLRGKLQPE